MANPLKKERAGAETVAPAPVSEAPESASVPESGIEKGKERPSAERVEPAKPETLQKPSGVTKTPRVTPPAKKDPIQSEVERILAEDIEELFRALPPDRQEKFNTRGDEVVIEVFGMIARAKASAKRILKLIRGWLTMIPGINRFFLEQEAKIKTDRLMALAEREKEKKEQK